MVFAVWAAPEPAHAGPGGARGRAGRLGPRRAGRAGAARATSRASATATRPASSPATSRSSATASARASAPGCSPSSSWPATWASSSGARAPLRRAGRSGCVRVETAPIFFVEPGRARGLVRVVGACTTGWPCPGWTCLEPPAAVHVAVVLPPPASVVHDASRGCVLRPGRSRSFPRRPRQVEDVVRVLSTSAEVTPSGSDYASAAGRSARRYSTV